MYCLSKLNVGRITLEMYTLYPLTKFMAKYNKKGNLSKAISHGHTDDFGLGCLLQFSDDIPLMPYSKAHYLCTNIKYVFSLQTFLEYIQKSLYRREGRNNYLEIKKVCELSHFSNQQ